MKTLDPSSIKALISLLDDPSEQIYSEIRETVLTLGSDGIPHLQEAFDNSDNDLQKERISELLDHLKVEKLEVDLKAWKEFHQEDLLAGLIKIAEYDDPNLDVNIIKAEISSMAAMVKASLNEDDSPEDVANILNQVILYDYGFLSNIRNYSGVNNSFINKVIEQKISNPIGLCILYLLVAKETNIPLVGINSPGHFILGFVDVEFSEAEDMIVDLMDSIMFYLDPFNSGQIVKPKDFDKWLLQIPFKLEDKIRLPATNLTVIQRVMNNLIYALFTAGDKETAKKLLQINEALSVG